MRDNNRIIRLVLVMLASLACGAAGVMPVAAKGTARPGPHQRVLYAHARHTGRAPSRRPGGAPRTPSHRPRDPGPASGPSPLGPGPVPAPGQPRNPFPPPGWPGDLRLPDLGDLRDLGNLGDLGDLGGVGIVGGLDTPGVPAPTQPPTMPTPTPPSTRNPHQRAGQSHVWPTTDDPRHHGAQIFQGWGFDICSAPSLDTMRAWRDSKYGAIGVYIGGRSRSCPQDNLTAHWVRRVTKMGWRLLPVYVGSQSPCATAERHRVNVIDEEDIDGQAAHEADDAVYNAERLGMERNSPIYLDMESYDTQYRFCTRPVLEFVQAWSRELRDRGYLPGFYSNVNAGIAQMERARRHGHPDLPDLLWFAHWGVEPDVYDEPKLSSGAWRPHRRVHQYAGDKRETHGGRTMVIDRDLVDAPVAIIRK
ncbi:glycoside hydrolase domain-containing protein [Streptantibioticus rubrisoli]|uniref:DUF1906 domain-containing protein n=1 Tax=Streptantibioticus rubrisoli TaxID=1387313 RepID=A0ABT1PCC4_9ACTN|nr:glycoside hydrolase domain-containing protein [Streptantibioticus rubrisoli]MCQ4043022.1 DUF1906 domain-containing protein [Streptantibioticus rubrisoli]